MKRIAQKRSRAKPERPDTAQNITAILARLDGGDTDAGADLMPRVYAHLRRIAASHFQHEKPGHTLQPTALIHEAYIRLVKPGKGPWKNRGHFFGVASRAMRQILVEHARARNTAKRGGSRTMVELDQAAGFDPQRPKVLLALDEALDHLEAVNRRQSRIVELRFFGGLTVKETAEALGVSTSTVKEDWALAKAWLRREIEQDRP